MIMDYIWRASHLCFEKCGVHSGDTFRAIWRRIIGIVQFAEMPRVITEISRDFAPRDVMIRISSEDTMTSDLL